MSRVLASLWTLSRSARAFNHTMALAPANIALHVEPGEALVLEAQGMVTPATEDEFAKAPDDPRSRYYAAEAALRHDDSRRGQKEIGRPAGECSLRCSVGPNRR